MAITLDVEREAFEKWVSEQPWFLATLYLARSGDEYADPCINSRWQGWKAHHSSQPAQVVDVERVLAALGHVRVPNTRCLARVAETPKELAPPGPRNQPMWCCLPEGHEGQHRHNGGGMYPSIPFRDTDEVVMVPLPDYCEKCNRVWPCDEAKTLTRAIGTAQEGWVSVPREPTAEMIAACIAVWQERLRHKAENGTLLCGGNAEKSFRENWAAMLSALPTPPADGEG